MGRIERWKGFAPPSIRKDTRAKQARHIINKIIPAILASEARARRGAENSELIIDPTPVLPLSDDDVNNKDDIQDKEDIIYVTRKGQGRRRLKNNDTAIDDSIVGVENRGRKRGQRKTRQQNNSSYDGMQESRSPMPPPRKGRTIRVISSDTLTVARILAFPSRHDSIGPASTKSHGKTPNVCLLNMASPLRPGGGVLSGATSQEEFLCARTTLLPSLKENFYRLPELGGIWTSDVLVFRSAAPLGEPRGEISSNERYWVDVISAGMIRFPELEGGKDGGKRWSEKDRTLVEAKMRAVLRIAARKGVKKLVLGAWGSGAYGNPVADVAKEWKNVLSSSPPGNGKGRKNDGIDVETFDGIEQIIFAISNDKMAHAFAQAFSDEITVEPGPVNAEDNDGDEEDGDNSVMIELRSKISEMQEQLGQVWNPELKARMQDILKELKEQLQRQEEVLGVRQEDADTASGEKSELISTTLPTEDMQILTEEEDQDDELQSSEDQGGIRIGK